MERTYRVASANIQDPNIEGSRSEECFDEHLAKVGADHLWVATINSKVVGPIGLIVNEKEAEIEPIIISKPYRNKVWKGDWLKE